MDSFERYSRQIQLSEIGKDGQRKLGLAKILIIGVGGLGCSAAQYLAASGVGTLGLMDYDLVDISNLNRQILYTPRDKGKRKVEVAGRALQELNDRLQVRYYFEQLTFSRALSLFPEYDLVIDGTDNFLTKYIINDACVITSKPWVYASVFKFQGQLSVFNYNSGPTYRCLYPEVSLRNTSCEEVGVLGALPGILGTLQSVEAIKILLQIGEVLSGRLLVLDLLTMQNQYLTFSRTESQVEKAKNRNLDEGFDNEVINSCEKVYLDVRDMMDSSFNHNENVLHIPMHQLEARYGELPRDVPIHVYCQSGMKSREAIRLLSRKYGFQNLINVNGGIGSLIK